MKRQQVIDRESASMANLYWKRPLVIARGRGATLWDLDGREFIDFTSNYGVSIVGHSHPKVVEAITRQAESLTSCHGTFYSEARSELLGRLVSIAPNGLTRTYLSNSGAEAVEFALKLAKRRTGRTGVVAMMGGFHGKTLGALSATWKKKYRESFGPMVPGYEHVPYGNADRLAESVSESTAAVIVEPIQGEGGINVPPDDYLPRVREICSDKGALLVLDEIQTGMGRTGKMLACEHNGVVPDIICLSKALASGLPMGATMASDETMSALSIGDHSSTFGGGPIVCAAAAATLDVLKEESLPARAASEGGYLMERLRELQSKYRVVREVRGRGLMIGVELRFDVQNVLAKAQERGVLALDAGRNVLRLLPPLVITHEQIDRTVEVIDEALRLEESSRLSG